MKVSCPECGKCIEVQGIGRKKGLYPVQNVLDAYQAGSSMYWVAIKFGLTRGTVKRILNTHGIDTSRGKKVKA